MVQRLTTAHALVRALCAQRDAAGNPLLGGVFAIFGHGNVAGLGVALEGGALRLLRAHNETAMGLAAVAYAKASRRRRFMACTTSIGPGATNLVTAAATAHVNRLPLLLLPGDTFADRGPDPVLQQLEDPRDPATSVNACLKPVSAFFTRVDRPEQLPAAIEGAFLALTDPARCGPATISLPQDVQAELHDWPDDLFAPRAWSFWAARADPRALERAAEMLRSSERPLVVFGGGVRYSEGGDAALQHFCEATGARAADTHAGRGALPAGHPAYLGGIGVTGSAEANAAAADADLVLAVGTRLSDFTTASRRLFSDAALMAINVDPADAAKHGATPLVADAAQTLDELRVRLEGWRARWPERAVASPPRPAAEPGRALLTDADVVETVCGWARSDTTVVAASGSLPGELQRGWRVGDPDDYHVEYGFSCMGYEVAGALGVKLARPEREVVALVGDGAYLMLNSELATAAELKQDLIVVLVDNGGFGCIHRLQRAVGGAEHSNLRRSNVNLALHARSLGAEVFEAGTDLKGALDAARAASGVRVVLVHTDPDAGGESGAPWRVPSAAHAEEAS